MDEHSVSWCPREIVRCPLHWLVVTFNGWLGLRQKVLDSVPLDDLFVVIKWLGRAIGGAEVICGGEALTHGLMGPWT